MKARRRNPSTRAAWIARTAAARQRLPTRGLWLLAATAGILACGGGADRGSDSAWDGFPFEIELEHLATISDAHQPGLLNVSRPPAAQVDAAGRFYFQTHGLAAIAVFGRQGEFLTNLGTRGRGPGEFEWTLPPVVGRGDSLFVFDGRLRRVAVFAPDLRFVRTAPVPHWPAIALPAAGYIVAQQIPSPGHRGYPLHHVAEDGQILRSFGTDNPVSTPGDASQGPRPVAASRSGGIWSVAPNRLLLERWSVETGERLQSVEPRGGWLPQVNSADPALLTSPVIVGLWEDADGLIWVLARTGKQDETTSARYDHEVAFDLADYSADFEWVLEVVDPELGETVAGRRFPYYLGFRGPGDAVTSVRHVEVGGTVFDIWRPVLQRRAAGS